jgi:hypothetical protein
VDPITARRVLRIFSDAPLTVELVERAFAGESSAKHPSLYEDASERRRAEEWALTLVAARDVLLAEARRASMSAPTPPTDAAAAAPARRRGLSPGAIIGIVAGATVLVALVTFATIGAINLATTAATTARDAIESEVEGLSESDVEGPSDSEVEGPSAAESGDPAVERYQSGETLFAFPAALEYYGDFRYAAECPAEYEQGCWQSALFTEADCDSLQIQLGFGNDFDAMFPEHLETMEKQDVIGNEATIVVFGNDDYGYGWINQVTCLDTPS